MNRARAGDLIGVLERILQAKARGESIDSLMKADEAARGFRVVAPGQVPWLLAEDWPPSVVVSIDGGTVRLVLIHARRPRCGSFRRLVAGIAEAGLVPCVVAPTRDLQSTLRRWGWCRHVVGEGIRAEDLWTPPAEIDCAIRAAVEARR